MSNFKTKKKKKNAFINRIHLAKKEEHDMDITNLERPMTNNVTEMKERSYSYFLYAQHLCSYIATTIHII